MQSRRRGKGTEEIAAKSRRRIEMIPAVSSVPFLRRQLRNSPTVPC